MQYTFKISIFLEIVQNSLLWPLLVESHLGSKAGKNIFILKEV